jgi:hypothetical protein
MSTEIIPDLVKAENPDNQKLANLLDGKLWDELKKSMGKSGGLVEFEAAFDKLVNK